MVEQSTAIKAATGVFGLYSAQMLLVPKWMMEQNFTTPDGHVYRESPHGETPALPHELQRGEEHRIRRLEKIGYTSR